MAVDSIGGLNLNHRECCWVHYGNDSCQELLKWVSADCEEFCEMKTVKHAKCLGTMIGPEGYLHRWIAPRKKIHSTRARKIKETSKNLVERLDDFKIYAFSVLEDIGSTSAPDVATLKEESHALQCAIAGSYNARPTVLFFGTSGW